VDGVVGEYDDREGFGVIESPDTPGGCWFHYSQIEVCGRRTLSAGQTVRFTFECDVDHDGFSFRAVRVRQSE
jgi:CspA family cold shock protein